MSNHWLKQLRGSKDTRYCILLKGSVKTRWQDSFCPILIHFDAFEHEIRNGFPNAPSLQRIQEESPTCCNSILRGIPHRWIQWPCVRCDFASQAKTTDIELEWTRHSQLILFRVVMISFCLGHLLIQLMHSLQNAVSFPLQHAKTCQIAYCIILYHLWMVHLKGWSSLLQSPRSQASCLLAPLSISELSYSFRRLAATIVGAKTFWTIEDRLQMDACKRLFDISVAISSVPSCASISWVPLLVRHQTQGHW